MRFPIQFVGLFLLLLCILPANAQRLFPSAQDKADSVEFMQHAPRSEAEAQILEHSLAAAPDDRTAHLRMAGYLWSQSVFTNRPEVRHKLVVQTEWFVVHEPQSYLFELAQFSYQPADFAAPYQADLARYKTEWLTSIHNNILNAVVLAHAATALKRVDLETTFRCNLVLRKLTPADPTVVVSLAAVYTSLIEAESSAPGVTPGSDPTGSFAALSHSRDAVVIGLVGQILLDSAGVTNGRPGRMAIYGEGLLKQAHEIDPANTRWTDALITPPNANPAAIFDALDHLRQRDLWPGGKIPAIPLPPGGIRVESVVQDSRRTSPTEAFLKNVLSVQSSLPGKIRLTALIGPDGHIQQIQFDSGAAHLFGFALNIVRDWQYTPTLVNAIPVSVLTQIDLNFTKNPPLSPEMTGGVMGPSVETLLQPGPAHVPGYAAEAMVTERVDPVYPAAARAAHLEGAVQMHALISKEGAVTHPTVISGPELLRPAALDAFQRWKFKPYVFHGKPREFETEITLNFTLTPGPSAPAAQTPAPNPASSHP